MTLDINIQKYNNFLVKNKKDIILNIKNYINYLEYYKISKISNNNVNTFINYIADNQTNHFINKCFNTIKCECLDLIKSKLCDIFTIKLQNIKCTLQKFILNYNSDEHLVLNLDAIKWKQSIQQSIIMLADMFKMKEIKIKIDDINNMNIISFIDFIKMFCKCINNHTLRGLNTWQHSVDKQHFNNIINFINVVGMPENGLSFEPKYDKIKKLSFSQFQYENINNNIKFLFIDSLYEFELYINNIGISNFNILD